MILNFFGLLDSIGYCRFDASAIPVVFGACVVLLLLIHIVLFCYIFVKFNAGTFRKSTIYHFTKEANCSECKKSNTNKYSIFFS